MAWHGDSPSSIPSSAPPLQTEPEETGKVMVWVREGGVRWGGGWVRGMGEGVRDEGEVNEAREGEMRCETMCGSDHTLFSLTLSLLQCSEIGGRCCMPCTHTTLLMSSSDGSGGTMSSYGTAHESHSPVHRGRVGKVGNGKQ